MRLFWLRSSTVQMDEVAEMARALLAYLKTPALIAGHGEQARRHAEQRFSIPAMAEPYATVYEQTLGRK